MSGLKIIDPDETNVTPRTNHPSIDRDGKVLKTGIDNINESISTIPKDNIGNERNKHTTKIALVHQV